MLNASKKEAFNSAHHGRNNILDYKYSMANPIIEFLKSKTVADMQAYPLKESTALVQANRGLLESAGSSGRTPLMWAALQHSHNLVYALLMAGADANKRSRDNKTALDEISATYNCTNHLKDDYIRFTLNERMKDRSKPIHEYVEVYDNGKTYVGGDLVSYKLPSGETKTYRLNETIGAAGYVPFGKHLIRWTEVQFSGPVYGPPAPRNPGCALPSLSSVSGQASVSGAVKTCDRNFITAYDPTMVYTQGCRATYNGYMWFKNSDGPAGVVPASPAWTQGSAVAPVSGAVKTCNPNFITAYDPTMVYTQGCRATYNGYMWYKNAGSSTGVVPASPNWTQGSATAPASGARGGARRRNRMSKRSKARRGSRAKRASRVKRGSRAKRV